MAVTLINDDRNSRSLRKYLQQRGMRCTTERLAILRMVGGTRRGFTIDDLYTALDSNGFHISRATLYSNLRLLERAGFVESRRCGNRGTVTYIGCGSADRGGSANTAPSGSRMTLQCTECGKIKEVKTNDALITALASEIHCGATALKGFEPMRVSVNVTGVCASCKRRKNRTRKKRN